MTFLPRRRYTTRPTTPLTGSLAGRVIDSDKLSPIKGVTVRIVETGQTAKTDTSGNYTIPNVRVGDITVIAKKRSYGGLQKSDEITNGVTTVVNFALLR